MAIAAVDGAKVDASIIFSANAIQAMFSASPSLVPIANPGTFPCGGVPFVANPRRSWSDRWRWMSHRWWCCWCLPLLPWWWFVFVLRPSTLRITNGDNLMTNCAGVHSTAATSHALIGSQRVTLDVLFFVHQSQGDAFDRLLKRPIPPRGLVVGDLAPNLFPRFLRVKVASPAVPQCGGVFFS